MQFYCPDTASMGQADHHGKAAPPPGAAPHPSRVGDDLVKGRKDEPWMLDLGDGPQTVQSHAHRRTHDGRFGKRSVEAALFPVLCLQASRGTEGASHHTHIFPKDHHPFILGHR